MSDHGELSDDEPDEPPLDPEEGRRLKNWSPPLGTSEDRWKADAYSRMLQLEQMLYHLYTTRGVSEPNLYPIDAETLAPGCLGPPDDGFPLVGEGDGRLVGRPTSTALTRSATVSAATSPSNGQPNAAEIMTEAGHPAVSASAAMSSHDSMDSATLIP